MGARASKTLAWGFAMAPHRLRALVFLFFFFFFGGGGGSLFLKRMRIQCLQEAGQSLNGVSLAGR